MSEKNELKDLRTIGTKLIVVGGFDGKGTDKPISRIKSIDEIGMSSDEIDVTTLDSEGGYKETIPGFKDAGTTGFEGYTEDPEILPTLNKVFNEHKILNWKVELPNKDTQEFKGYIKEIKDLPKTVEGIFGYKATIRISGGVTYTAHS